MMAPVRRDEGMLNLGKLMRRHKIDVKQLARAVDRCPNAINSVLTTGSISLELRLDIETVLLATGISLPRNLWVNSHGINLAKPTRTLRTLDDARVISVPNYHPVARERKLQRRYLSPHQFDPRKDHRMSRVSPTAMQKFGFKQEPFYNEMRSSDDVFEHKELKLALTLLERAVADRDMLAITGEVGSGKTRILIHFKERLRRNVIVCEPKTVSKTDLGANSLLDAIIHDLAGKLNHKEKHPSRREAKARYVLELLQAADRDQKIVALLIEEAHRLSLDCFKDLKVLHELMEHGYQRLLAILLVGQNEMIPRLNNPTMREFGQRCGRFQLVGLNGRTGAYIEHKLKRAGTTTHKVFELAAVKKIEEICTEKTAGKSFGPYPLQLNAFATLAINVADDLGEELVTVQVIDKIRPLTASQERQQ